MKLNMEQLILVIIMIANLAHATVQYDAANHITGQVTILEDGGIYTPLFWEAINEKSRYDIHQFADANGYSYTEFPYLIESILGFLFMTLVTVGLMIKIKRTRNWSLR
jgi:hypothetical protein